MHINNITTQEDAQTGTTIYSGDLGLSGATFTAEVEGSGNSATYRITIEGGQFDMHGEPLYISIVGEWEMMELFEIMKLITPKV